jgi:hypothetical protein
MHFLIDGAQLKYLTQARFHPTAKACGVSHSLKDKIAKVSEEISISNLLLIYL